jgi:hypothetical protein
MRLISFLVVGLGLCAALGVTDIAAAQPLAPPTIHRVTLRPDTGVLTISGTGLGPELFVSVDGQPVPQLPGATDTQMELLAPASVLTTPGSYRLTVVDTLRQVGDAFVVASQAATVAVGSAALTGTRATAAEHATVPAGPAVAGSEVQGARRSVNGPAPLVIEDSSPPYRTALGYEALKFNTSGVYNTATGVWTLESNTSGNFNTASGARALGFTTTGSNNTASGAFALFYNTTGNDNTASGYEALLQNTGGQFNTASGRAALYSNTIGNFNTADGYAALYATTTGGSNTGSGYEALRFNTTGSSNTASGNGALYSNSTGLGNTGIGAHALYVNNTGSNNTALGVWAGANAGGSYNVHIGANTQGTAADTNTIRIGLPYSGGVGQNRTFIAGIHGTQVSGGYLQVVVNADGQLGTLTPPVQLSGGATATPLSVLQQQVQGQQATITAQQATIEGLLARLARLEAASAGSRRR